MRRTSSSRPCARMSPTVVDMSQETPWFQSHKCTFLSRVWDSQLQLSLADVDDGYKQTIRNSLYADLSGLSLDLVRCFPSFPLSSFLFPPSCFFLLPVFSSAIVQRRDGPTIPAAPSTEGAASGSRPAPQNGSKEENGHFNTGLARTAWPVKGWDFGEISLCCMRDAL